MLTVAQLIGLLSKFSGGERVVIRDGEIGMVVDVVGAIATNVDLNQAADNHHKIIDDKRGVPVALIEISR